MRDSTVHALNDLCIAESLEIDPLFLGFLEKRSDGRMLELGAEFTSRKMLRSGGIGRLHFLD